MPELCIHQKIRSAWDKDLKKHWFSVIDICAAIMDSDYQTARGYWKWLKNKLASRGSELVLTIHQLKFEAQDGKLRYTDVMDAREILQLIQLFPSQKAARLRLWLAELILLGASVTEHLAEAFVRVKNTVKVRVGGFIRTVRRRVFDLRGGVRGIMQTPAGGTAALRI